MTPSLSKRIERACHALLNSHNKMDQQSSFEIAKEELARICAEADVLQETVKSMETVKASPAPKPADQ